MTRADAEQAARAVSTHCLCCLNTNGEPCVDAYEMVLAALIAAHNRAVEAAAGLVGVTESDGFRRMSNPKDKLLAAQHCREIELAIRALRIPEEAPDA